MIRIIYIYIYTSCFENKSQSRHRRKSSQNIFRAIARLVPVTIIRRFPRMAGHRCIKSPWPSSSQYNQNRLAHDGEVAVMIIGEKELEELIKCYANQNTCINKCKEPKLSTGTSRMVAQQQTPSQVVEQYTKLKRRENAIRMMYFYFPNWASL